MGSWTSAAIVALLGGVAATSSVAACARFGVDGGDDGDRAATGATDPTVPSDTLGVTEASGKGGAATPTSASLADADAGAALACAPTIVPAGALAQVQLVFDGIDTGGASKSWHATGFDRDGLCTTAVSTDVCARVPGASITAQQDGDNGIDNAWGHTVEQLLAPLAPTKGAGYLTTDAAGSGTLIFASSGAWLHVPVVSARVVRLGTTATISALVPTEAFVAVVAKLGSQLNLSLCTGIGIQQLEESVRQASDMPLAGAQSPSVACTAISLGATLTGVVDGLPPTTQPSPTTCPL